MPKADTKIVGALFPRYQLHDVENLIMIELQKEPVRTKATFLVEGRIYMFDLAALPPKRYTAFVEKLDAMSPMRLDRNIAQIDFDIGTLFYLPKDYTPK